ncbi:MAG: hypothetical protein LQ338_005993 [Usnochroma carphineum]|nr:MAG: hypothetical protein LQ338_005993 [Usnochroma carphineum]
MARNPRGSERTALQRSNDGADTDLWSNALKNLTRTEQDCIKSHLHESSEPEKLLLVSQAKRDETWKNRLSVKRRNGEKLFIYDIFGKIAKWIEKFVSIGDVAVQYDPAHAALPWAAVRFVLQACISDVQKCAFILESMEKVSEIITWSRIHEKLYLTGDYEATAGLNVFDTETEASDDMARLEENRKRVDRTASLIASETLFRESTIAQDRHQTLVSRLQDMQVPMERLGAVTDESHEILVKWQRDRILDSLSNIPYVNHHQEVYRKVLQDSGKWLLDSPITHSIMIEYLLQRARAGRIPYPAYFYCSRNAAESSRAKPAQILRSVLRQLADSRSDDTLPRCLFDSPESLKSLDREETVDLIIRIADTQPVTHIVIDGLDECETDLLFEIIEGLEAILERTQSLVKIFVSGRNDLDLIRWLRAYPDKEILSSDNQSDINSFVDSEVDKRISGSARRFRARKVSDGLREHIKATLKAEANGMWAIPFVLPVTCGALLIYPNRFRWVELQLQYIGTLYTEDDVRRRLGSLPKSLNDIYDDVYQKNMRIHRETDPKYEEQAKTIFHLLLSSRQTWSLSDMANLIDPSEDWADPETEKITGLTFDLVTHDKQLNIVRFAHLSVREYLERNHADFCNSSRAHEYIAITCIEYLEKTETFIYSPVEYPGEWWVYHFLQAPRSDRLMKSLFHFLLENNAGFQSWTMKLMQEKDRHSPIRLPGADFHFQVTGRIDQLTCEPPSAILMASWLGLIDVVNALLQADASCVDCRSFSGVSPLFLACEMGHTEVASILIQNTVIDSSGVFEDGALSVAIKNGHKQIVQQFLSYGYDLRKRAEIHGGEHLVWLAVQSGRGDIVAQLLDAGASAHGEGGLDCADTALYTASENRADLVALLLQNGADPQTQDGREGYAINMAAAYNNLGAARLLVEHGANVNANDYGDTPYAARRKRYKGIWPRPVSHGGTLRLSLRTSRRKGSTPLFSAVHGDHEEMVEFLLHHGADPVPRFPIDRKIFRGAMNRQSLIGSRLLALNTSLNDLDLGTMMSTIRLASEDAILERMKLHELKPDSETLSYALDVAAEKGYEKLLTALIKYAMACDFGRGVFASALLGCAQHSQTANFQTLWAAACYQDGRPVPEKEWHKDQHIKDSWLLNPDGYNPRYYFSFLKGLSDAASTSKSAQILNILAKAQLHSTKYHLDQLQVGDGDPSRQKWLAGTLNEVVKSGRLDELRLLLGAGADPNALFGRNMQTPLIAAVYGHQKEVVQILLESGADPNLQVRQRSGYYTNYTTLPLLAASGEPNAFEILEILLKHGASVNVRLKEGFGPSECRPGYQVSDVSTTSDEPSSNDILTSDDELEKSAGNRSAHNNRSRNGESQDGEVQDEDPRDGDPQDGDPQNSDSEASDMSHDFPEEQLVLTKAIADVLDTRQSSVSSNSSDSAAETSRTKLVELLLEHNKDPSIVPRVLVPAMYYTIQGDTIDMGTLNFLLAHGVDVNVPNGQQASPLAALVELAQEPVDLKVIEMLLHRGAKANSGSHKHKSALQCAVTKPTDSPRERIIDILIAHGADPNARHFERSNALQFACQEGADERMVACLLSKGVNVNAPGGRFGNALQAACYKHHDLKVIELLLLHGADVNACGGKWGTALQAACLSSLPVRLMRLLHAHRADVNAHGGYFGCALQAACSLHSDKLAAVEYVLHMGADINWRGGRYGNALICACIMRNDAAVELLLDHGADMTYTHHVYGNPLHAACMEGGSSTVQLLLKHGISADERGGIYDHAIFAALFHWRNFEAVAIFANHIKDLNLQHAEFGTPLIAAVLAGDRASVQVLLERGADVNLQGGTYGTPLQAAATHSNEAMVRLLLEYSAEVNALGGRYGSALQAACARKGDRVLTKRRKRSLRSKVDRAISLASTDADDTDGDSESSSSAWSDDSVQLSMLGLVDLLLQHGADVNAEGGVYGTSLHAATHFRHDDLVKKLLAHGARPTDAITRYFVKGLKTQYSSQIVGGELQPIEESDGDNTYPINWDRVGEKERRFIPVDKDELDREKSALSWDIGAEEWAETRRRLQEMR